MSTRARRAAVDKYTENLFMCLACKGAYEEAYSYPLETYVFCPCCGVEIDHSVTPKGAEHLRRKLLRKSVMTTAGQQPTNGVYSIALKRRGTDCWEYAYRLCSLEKSVAYAYQEFLKECRVDRPSFSEFGLFKGNDLLLTRKNEVRA